MNWSWGPPGHPKTLFLGFPLEERNSKALWSWPLESEYSECPCGVLLKKHWVHWATERHEKVIGLKPEVREPKKAKNRPFLSLFWLF